MSLSSYNGQSNFTIKGKKFIKRGADNIYDIASVAGTSGNFSTGWVNTDGTTAVANLARLTFNHNLGTTDLNFTVYAADDSAGSNSCQIPPHDVLSGGFYGAQIEDLTDSSFILQFSKTGFIKSRSNSSSPTPTFNWSGKYVKVVASAGGGGGGQAYSGVSMVSDLPTSGPAYGSATLNPPQISNEVSLPVKYGSDGNLQTMPQLTRQTVDISDINSALLSTVSQYTSTAAGGVNGAIVNNSSSKILFKGCTLFNNASAAGYTVNPVGDNYRASTAAQLLINGAVAMGTNNIAAQATNVADGHSYAGGRTNSVSLGDIVLPAGGTMFLYQIRGNFHVDYDYLPKQTSYLNDSTGSALEAAGQKVGLHQWYAYGQFPAQFKFTSGDVFVL